MLGDPPVTRAPKTAKMGPKKPRKIGQKFGIKRGITTQNWGNFGTLFWGMGVWELGDGGWEFGSWGMGDRSWGMGVRELGDGSLGVKGDRMGVGGWGM